MARLPLLLALTCLGSGAVLVGGRALLDQIPAADPNTSSANLERLLWLSPNPARRREARLLLLARQEEANDPASQRRLLRGQGWGRDSLAALVLKRDAIAAEALGDPSAAQQRWQRLLRHFPQTPATADALYALGRSRPELRRELLTRFAAHPAALAAALEAGPTAAARRDGALHLARHGVRWPGAAARLRQTCGLKTAAPTPKQRDQLAAGLAQLGDAEAALACLNGTPPGLDTQLALGKAMLSGNGVQQGQDRLLQLARSAPRSPQAAEAVALLSDQPGASSLQALATLPATLQDTAPVQARRALETPGNAAVMAVLKRWPNDPASWELQWQRARQALLARQWPSAEILLAAPIDGNLPAALVGRQRFWLGFSQWQQGQRSQARQTWSALLQQHPQGYYGWRAAVRLGRGDLALDPQRSPALMTPSWQPLASGDVDLDRLWRLDQPLEAWEHWRTGRSQPPSSPRELVLEGRLRRGVGDHWIGLGQLEQASLRLTPQRSGLPPAQHCKLTQQVERSLQTASFVAELEQAAAAAKLPTALLAAVAKQESRFSPGVRSSAGAVGLLQLMPDTAAELASQPLEPGALLDPGLNAQLGALYLKQMLRQWQGNPVLMAASYNAGPGAVAGWVNPQLQQEPELWIEAIPYPETRLYVKKVLGNLWSFQQRPLPGC